MLLHNSFGILLAEHVFGLALTNSAGRRVFVRDLATQHILEDLGFVPSVAQCLDELPLRPWMASSCRGSVAATAALLGFHQLLTGVPDV